MNQRRFAFRPRFGLRTALALTVLVALLGRWIGGDYARYRAEQGVLERLIASKSLDSFERARSGYPWWPPVSQLWLTRRVDGETLQEVSRLTHLTDLALLEASVTDDGWNQITQLPRLEVLIVQDTQLTDEQIVSLGAAQRLRLLTLQGTEVTDEGTARLRERLPQLEILDD